MGARQNITLDVNHLMSEVVGARYGITRESIEAREAEAKAAVAAVQKARGTGMMGWTELPHMPEEDIRHIEETAQWVRENFDAFVVLGIGGSALGPIAVHQALSHLRYNELPAGKRAGPKLYVEDNVDPERMQTLMDVIDLKRTCFNVVTKSGGTAETMSQYLIVSRLLKDNLGENWRDHIIATTDREKGNLIKLAQEEGFRRFVIPSGVGGRFSELSAVGLLPAAVCGINVRGLLEGARAMDERCKSPDVWQNPALLEAVIQVVAMEEMDVNVLVMMPYADSLRYMADWFCQLWAESLGKNVTRKGMAVNVGQTPVKSLGVTDQHSQLQLYTEGPYDKIVTFLRVNEFKHTFPIPHGAQQFEDVAFLGGKTLNALLDAEYRGTQYALLRAGRMSQTIELPEVSPHAVGQLLFMLEMATAYAGELLDVDAFNQPGVEESKLASYAVLGNTGEKFRRKQEEMANAPQPLPEYRLG
ncbi:MAG TPA: glucose-6-phosphate isomerase [Candidatus Limnocylindria bacterium]|nr:glucose-6-phosphate isomerase [Candidatus Limnocylindria bacterium]